MNTHYKMLEFKTTTYVYSEHVYPNHLIGNVILYPYTTIYLEVRHNTLG